MMVITEIANKLFASRLQCLFVNQVTHKEASLSLFHHRRLTRENRRKKAQGREEAAKGSLGKRMEIHPGISVRLLIGMGLVAPGISPERNPRH